MTTSKLIQNYLQTTSRQLQPELVSFMSHLVVVSFVFCIDSVEAPVCYASATKRQGIGMLDAGWDISREPGSQAPTKSSDSHEIFAEIHAVLKRI